jgi:hypothetical protein
MEMWERFSNYAMRAWLAETRQVGNQGDRGRYEPSRLLGDMESFTADSAAALGKSERKFRRLDVDLFGRTRKFSLFEDSPNADERKRQNCSEHKRQGRIHRRQGGDFKKHVPPWSIFHRIRHSLAPFV